MDTVLNFFDFKQKVDYKTEILSGLTVALALVPEAVAFALIAGLSPITGLYAAFVMGLITSVFGGRPGMISGATGAVAVVIVALAAQYGPEYIFACVILAGVLQMAAGFLKLGKLMRLVPHPAIYGFVNGLAIVIFMSQIVQFRESPTGPWLAGTDLYVFVGLVALSMLIIWGLPKLTKAVPAALVAILTVWGLVVGFGIDTSSVGDMAGPGGIAGGFPPFHIPEVPFTWETLVIVFPYAAIVAAVGLIESLLTLNIIDEITETRGHGNREAVAQGAANFLSGFFSGMGGCAMIGQSLINISSGARARLSGIVASLLLLSFIMFGSSLIELVPMAALTGLMIMVAIGTFEWASLRTINKVPKADVIVMVLVTLVTVFLHNLALAVIVGVIISALVFAYEMRQAHPRPQDRRRRGREALRDLRAAVLRVRDGVQRQVRRPRRPRPHRDRLHGESRRRHVGHRGPQPHHGALRARRQARRDHQPLAGLPPPHGRRREDPRGQRGDRAAR